MTQTARQQHDQHDYSAVLGSVDQYYDYMTTRGQGLLSQVSFNPPFAYAPQHGIPQGTPTTPPTYAGFASPLYH